MSNIRTYGPPKGSIVRVAVRPKWDGAIGPRPEDYILSPISEIEWKGKKIWVVFEHDPPYVDNKPVPFEARAEVVRQGTASGSGQSLGWDEPVVRLLP